ncbi:probable G-protein coupled receptor Mth-like 5 isoform X2 [Daktulosphaira vitifoliae]|uniref:probable G-protein coupled receptor Mth-like 5 isoform X2 n=1 Tax=Daktulosphaira vitifoliae TaxID=58002 RepID=UPI0021AA89B5|nr:probable G-protein coupled receptor Mth-like 5 isoform X2 [Daktulosphaira vitifoliae]
MRCNRHAPVMRYRAWTLLLAVFLWSTVCAASLQQATTVVGDEDDVPVASVSVVHKCCGRDALTGYGPWTPEFTLEDGEDGQQKKLPALSVPYKLVTGFPNCKNRQQWLVYHYKGSGDRLSLFPSGKLRHYVLKHQHGHQKDQPQDFVVEHERSFDYEQGFYCLDKVIDIDRPDLNAQVAVICTPQIPSPWTDTDFVMRRVANPACHSVAVICLLLVAIVHFVLPQLRDLIGNMVTTLACLMIVAEVADIVRIFVEYNSPISYLIADSFLYISTLGSFFWLNAMGYYIWKTFRSRNVFLRITDGRKYCYYSLYVWGCTLAMGGMALFAHLILDTSRQSNPHINYQSKFTSSSIATDGAIGWLGIAVIFVPAVCTVLVNLFFYSSTKSVIKRMSTYGQIHHKMKYSFDMFSKLFGIMVVNLMLFVLSWTPHDAFFYVYVVANPILSIFVLYVTVIRPKRVKFLLRKACCFDRCLFPCCRPKETDIQAGTEWGEEMMAFNTADY